MHLTCDEAEAVHRRLRQAMIRNAMDLARAFSLGSDSSTSPVSVKLEAGQWRTLYDDGVESIRPPYERPSRETSPMGE